jgi:hypothetical protein
MNIALTRIDFENPILFAPLRTLFALVLKHVR